jgi:hypothetical protein
MREATMKQPPAASIESTMIVIARGLGSPSFAAARDHLVHDQAERSDVHLHIPLMHAGIILRKERIRIVGPRTALETPQANELADAHPSQQDEDTDIFEQRAP